MCGRVRGFVNRNPFEILGIAPEMVRELDEKALYALVKACYRALQRTYHPDIKNGAKDRAVELNLAFEALDLERNPESFHHYRKDYLRRLSRRTQKRTIYELTKKVALLIRQQELLIQNYWNHLLEMYRLKGGPTLFPESPKKIKVTLLDLSLKFNLPFVNFGRNLAFKEILFDEKGRLFYRFPRKRKFQPVNFLTLVGSVPRQRLEIWSLLLKRPTLESGLSGLPDLRDFEVLNVIETEIFKKACLPLLRTELLENAYLFSFRKGADQTESSLYVEGMVLKIESASKEDFDKIVKKMHILLQESKKLPHL